MILTDAMAAGAAGGLLALLVGAMMEPWVAARTDVPGAPADSYGLRTLQVLLTLCAAALMGALYWLSWGLAAVVNVDWWERGVLFALVCWGALALPVLLTLRTRLGVDTRVLSVAIGQWLLTCLGAGLACAWSAARWL